MTKPLTKHGWSWAAVPADVIISGELSANDVRLYAYLLWRAGKHDSAWPNLTTISKDISLSEGGIKRSLKTLLKNNWIKRHRRFAHSSLTVVYETQAACLLDHGRSDDQITGDLTIGSPVIPLNKSQVKENQRTGATPTAPTLSDFGIERKYPAEKLERVGAAQALTNGIARHEGFTAEIETQFATRPNWDTKTNRSAVQSLKEQGATREQVATFRQWYYANDWRGKQGQAPTPPLIAELWPQAFTKRETPPSIYDFGTVYQ